MTAFEIRISACRLKFPNLPLKFTAKSSPCGIELYAGSQSDIPTQIRFSLRGHHLVLPLSRLILQYQTNLFCGYVKIKVYEIHVDNIDDLNRRIREPVEQFPKDMLQCFMTFLPPILQDCMEHGRHLQSVVLK